MRRRLTGAALALLALGTSPTPASAQEGGLQPPEHILRYLRSEMRGQKFGRAWIERARHLRELRAPVERGAPAPPPGVHDLRGTFRTPVLAGTYSDVEPRYAPARYAGVFFDATGADGAYTVNQFFREASGGAFGFAGTVTPWIRLEKTRAYYIDGFSNARRGRFEEYLYDVLVRADQAVNWAEFDNDGPDGVPDSGDDDGYVDMAVFLHPLADGICRSDELAGPVATGFRLEYLQRFGRAPFTTRVVGKSGERIRVDDFILSAGLDCDGSSISTMNINIHEMGHALGLPDLNDLDRSSYGVGVWDVMGYGLYASAGRPAMLGAWSRRQLGWAREETITAPVELVLEPTLTSRRIYRIDIPGVNESFLLENRQRVGADAALPGTGLLLWHVNEDILRTEVPRYRGTEDEDRSGLAVIQADGRRHLQSALNVGDASDPFPGSDGVTAVTAGTAVHSRGSNGAPSGIELHRIQEEGQAVRLIVAFSSSIFVPGASMPKATLGERGYTARLAAYGGSGALTFSASGSLPAWIKVESDGTVRATPTEPGEATLHFAVMDEAGRRAEGSATLRVVLPAMSEPAVLEALLGGAPLTEVQQRALDLIGNRNGRFDLGDVHLYRKGQR